jgi:hypothetical protein
MSATADDLDARLVAWMTDHRPALDTLMAQEASRAVHMEFLAAESGELPDRATRLARAREASIRAWLRHLGHAAGAELPGGSPELGDRLERYMAAHQERREAYELEEQAALERFGRSGDPEGDVRDISLVSHAALFAEALAAETDLAGEVAAPNFARRVSARMRAAQGRRREIEAEARAAWSADPAPMENRPATAGERVEPDEARVIQAAAVWAHVLVLTESLAQELVPPPAGEGGAG